MSRHTMLTLFMTVILAVFWLPPANAQEDQDGRREARAIWLRGFELYEQAEELMRRENLAEALSQFRQALQLFEQVKSRHPRWNSALIEYRISLCRKKIVEAEAVLAKLGKPTVPVDVPAEQARIADLERTVAQLRRELQQQQASLEQARRESARGTQATAEVRSLLAAKSELEKRSAALEAENRHLQQAASATPAGEQLRQEVEQRRTENEQLRQAQIRLQAELDSQRQSASSLAQQKTQADFEVNQAREREATLLAERDKLATDLRSMARIADERNAGQTALTQEMVGLREALANEKTTTDNLRRDLRELRGKSGDADVIVRQLQVENERLLQDVEAIHLRLAAADAEKVRNARALDEGGRRLADVERLLAGVEADRKAARQQLEDVAKKLLIEETVKNRQLDLIADGEKRQAQLQDQLKTVSLDLGRLQEKEKSFTELALHTTKVEETNRQWQRRLAAVDEQIARAEVERKTALDGQAAMRRQVADLEKAGVELKRQNLDLTTAAQQIPELRTQAAQTEKMAATIAALSQEQAAAEQQALTAAAQASSLKTAAARLEDDLRAARQTAAEHEKELIAVREQKAAAPPPPSPEVKAQLAAAEQQVARLQADAVKEAAQRAELATALRERELRIAKLEAQPAVTAPPPPPAETSAPTTAAATPVVSPLAIAQQIQEALAAETAGKREAAIWQYQQIIAQDPDNLEALSRLGIIAAEMGQDEAARTHLEKALRLDPDDVEKLLALSFTYLRLGQHYPALGTLARAAAQDPRNPDLQRYLGVACANLGWQAAAERQFKTSFEMDNTSAETAFNLAVLIITSAPEQRREEAQRWYRQAVELGAETDPGMDELFK